MQELIAAFPPQWYTYHNSGSVKHFLSFRYSECMCVLLELCDSDWYRIMVARKFGRGGDCEWGKKLPVLILISLLVLIHPPPITII